MKRSSCIGELGSAGNHGQRLSDRGFFFYTIGKAHGQNNTVRGYLIWEFNESCKSK